MQDAIANGTPIDTGRAISSWNIAENDADPTTTPALRINRKEHAAQGASTLTKEQAMGVMRGRRQAISEQAQVIVISNALDYIEDLENGSSRQAPNGIVRAVCTQQVVEHFVSEAINMASNPMSVQR